MEISRHKKDARVSSLLKLIAHNIEVYETYCLEKRKKYLKEIKRRKNAAKRVLFVFK